MTTEKPMRLAAMFASLAACLSLAADWPGFRGPHTDGTSNEHGLPIHFSATENVLWKTPLPGPGASSPIAVRAGGRGDVTASHIDQPRSAPGALASISVFLSG